MLLRVNKRGPPRVWSLPYTQNSGECSLAVWQERPPWPWVYLGTSPQRLGGPMGEQGNPFQEIFFHLVVYSIPQKPFQIQLLEVTWGLSVEFEEEAQCGSCNCPSCFGREPREVFQETSICSPECIMSCIYVLKRQDKHLWRQLSTN